MALAQKQTHREWNRTEIAEMNSQSHGQLIMTKDKNLQWGKVFFFNKWYLKNWINETDKIKWN